MSAADGKAGRPRKYDEGEKRRRVGLSMDESAHQQLKSAWRQHRLFGERFTSFVLRMATERCGTLPRLTPKLNASAPLQMLDLPPDMRETLRADGKSTIADIAALTDKQLLAIPQVGPAAAAVIHSALQMSGHHLAVEGSS